MHEYFTLRYSRGFFERSFGPSLPQERYETTAEMSSLSRNVIGALVTNGFCSTNEMLRIFTSINYWILDGYCNVGDLLFPLIELNVFIYLLDFTFESFDFPPGNGCTQWQRAKA